MSNNANLNSFGVGSSNLDEDARLLGGLGTASAVASAVIVGIILQGGVPSEWQTNPNQYTYPFIGGVSSGSNAYGNIAALAIGGVDAHGGSLGGGIGIGIPAEFASDGEVGSDSWRMSPGSGGFNQDNGLYGKLYIPLTLWSGVSTRDSVGGEVYWKDGLYGGIASVDRLGGNLVTDCILEAAMGSGTGFDAKVYIAAELDGGLGSDNEVQALHHKNIILQGGVENPPTVGGVITPANQTIVGGVHTSSEIHSQFLREQALRGGFIDYHTLGGELVVHVYLREGMVTVGEFNADLVATVNLGSGVASSSDLDGRLINSTVRSGGTSRNSAVGGKIYTHARLQGGVARSSIFHGNYKKINNVGNGGVDSSSSNGASMVVAPTLAGGIHRGSKVEGYFFKSIRLQGGNSCTSSVGAKIFTSVMLQGVVTRYSSMDGKTKVDCVLQGEYNSSNSGLYASYSMTLVGGIDSGWSLTNTDISAYNGDMLHNTWQLEIASVTDILGLETPLGDS